MFAPFASSSDPQAMRRCLGYRRSWLPGTLGIGKPLCARKLQRAFAFVLMIFNAASTCRTVELYRVHRGNFVKRYGIINDNLLSLCQTLSNNNSLTSTCELISLRTIVRSESRFQQISHAVSSKALTELHVEMINAEFFFPRSNILRRAEF